MGVSHDDILSTIDSTKTVLDGLETKLEANDTLEYSDEVEAAADSAFEAAETLESAINAALGTS